MVRCFLSILSNYHNNQLISYKHWLIINEVLEMY